MVIASKANELGHLFGSVSERDIATNLREQGFEIADNMVKLSHGHIKEVGSQEITIRLAAELTATVNVVVVPLSEDVESDGSDDENTEE